MWENASPESPITLRDPRAPGVARQHPRGEHKERSVVEPASSIKGEVSGGEDLLIEGRIEGRLSLTGCSITVGREGRIQADLLAKTIQVDGFSGRRPICSPPGSGTATYCTGSDPLSSWPQFGLRALRFIGVNPRCKVGHSHSATVHDVFPYRSNVFVASLGIVVVCERVVSFQHVAD